MERDFFEVLVAGDNPTELIKPYDDKIEVDEYIVYKFKDAKKIKQKRLDVYKSIIDTNVSPGITNYYKEEYTELSKMGDEDAYFYLTSEYDYDNEGNAVSTKNPKGKYMFFQKGKLFSVPFITVDGREVYQAKKGEIDWLKMHLHGSEIYRAAWEMVMEGKKPKNEYEENIYKNMKERTAYFQNFGTKENYVIYSTAFWAYAFVDKKDWYELEETMNQYEWVSNFYERFIDPLPDDTLLTIFECKK